MRIGLLGGSGLIGQDLSEIAEIFGIEVEVFSRNEGSLGHAREYSLLSASDDLDAIVNLVGGHKQRDFGYGSEFQLHIDDLVCEWSRRLDRPFIFMSSGSVFDPLTFPVETGTPKSPRMGTKNYS
jgi:dTDP-4-dehydrorhamnose reductase